MKLTRPTRLDVHLELDLATAAGHLFGPVQAEAIADLAAARAHEAGDEAGEALTRVVVAINRCLTYHWIHRRDGGAGTRGAAAARANR